MKAWGKCFGSLADNESFHVVTRTGFRKIHSAVDSDVLAIKKGSTDNKLEPSSEIIGELGGALVCTTVSKKNYMCMAHIFNLTPTLP